MRFLQEYACGASAEESFAGGLPTGGEIYLASEMLTFLLNFCANASASGRFSGLTGTKKDSPETHGKQRESSPCAEDTTDASPTAPVSYTHLDVYKRQVLFRG